MWGWRDREGRVLGGLGFLGKNGKERE